MMNITGVLIKLNELITKLFYKLGFVVGANPSYFIIIPIFLSLLSVTNIQNLRAENDPEYLYSPEGGQGQIERQSIGKIFPVNQSNFSPSTLVGVPLGFAKALVSAKADNIFTMEAWRELVLLDQQIRNITVEWDDVLMRYEDMCCTFRNECFENSVLLLTEFMPEITNGTYHINYPVMLIPRIGPGAYGSPVVDHENHVLKSAKSIQLGYFVKSTTFSEKQRAKIWEKKVDDLSQSAAFEHITPYVEVSTSLSDGLNKNAEVVKLHFAVNIVLMLSFSCVSLWSIDWVRSKIGLGFIGILSSLLAIAAGFGFLIGIGVPYITLNMAILFLILGIGLDDQYVMLSSWHRTDPAKSVPERLAETYSEAAISITITSLTNALSFFIGVSSELPSVSIFCLYAGVTVFLTYCWFLCIFGGFLAIAGRSEGKNKHCLTTRVVQPKSQSENRGAMYRLFCAGGINSKDPKNPKDNEERYLAIFFRDHLAKLLMRTSFKVCIFLVFVAYLSGAIYGLGHTVEGLERKHLMVDDSYFIDYIETDKTFGDFSYRVQVVINETLTYSDPKVKKQILDLHDTFQESKFVGRRIFTESYIRQFYNFLRPRKQLQKSITDEVSFIKVLREKYFIRNSAASRDFKFNENGTKIVSSRFIIQAVDVRNSTAEVEWMTEMRSIAASAPFKAFVYHPYYIFMDQYTMTLSATIKAIVYATAAMAVVSVILMPNILCCCAVLFSIISIEIGVMGYMALWNVNLDGISMVNVIMCIGFSVDFSAHVSYAFVSSKGRMEDRIKETLHHLGIPILQGGISTILGVVTLSMAPSYSFRVFFKIITLVIIFGVWHSLFLLPVIFTFLNWMTINGEPASTTSKGHVNNGLTMDDGKQESLRNNSHTEIDSVEKNIEQSSNNNER